MSTDSNETQSINSVAHSQPEAKQPQPEASTPTHGSTGEGAGSAMARLISQEQARVVPGAPEDEPNGLP